MHISHSHWLPHLEFHLTIQVVYECVNQRIVNYESVTSRMRILLVNESHGSFEKWTLESPKKKLAKFNIRGLFEFIVLNFVEMIHKIV